MSSNHDAILPMKITKETQLKEDTQSRGRNSKINFCVEDNERAEKIIQCTVCVYSANQASKSD